MRTRAQIRMSLMLASVMFAALWLVAVGAHADERRGRERHEAAERYHSPHWHYDDRYRHGRYYPAFGYSVTALPLGYVNVTYRGGRYFFHGGVWYRASGPVYLVVRPPVGIVVPILPPAYATVWIAGAPYYYANDTYYVSAPGGAGYAVAVPPSAVEPAITPPPTAPGSWYYCDSAKAYYPYVQECKEGWRAVPAVPPGK